MRPQLSCEVVFLQHGFPAKTAVTAVLTLLAVDLDSMHHEQQACLSEHVIRANVFAVRLSSLFSGARQIRLRRNVLALSIRPTQADLVHLWARCPTLVRCAMRNSHRTWTCGV